MHQTSEEAFRLSSSSFRDLDAFREGLWGWDTDAFQLSKGRLRIDYDSVHAEGLTVGLLGVNQRVADFATTDAGLKTFVVTLAAKKWCGVEVPPGSLVVMGAGREYSSVLAPGWRSIEFTVSDERLRDAGLPWADAGCAELAPERCVFPVPNAALALVEAWSRGLSSAIRAASSPSGPEAQPIALARWAADVGEDALATILPALLPPSTHPLPLETHSRASFELVREAIEAYEAAGTGRPTVADLALALGLSRRTLELAFRRALGCSPYQYFLARRLGIVRKQVLRGTSVTDAALAQCFESLGRFSDQYRRLFGELPSQTRASAACRSGTAEGKATHSGRLAPGPG